LDVKLSGRVCPSQLSWFTLSAGIEIDRPEGTKSVVPGETF